MNTMTLYFKGINGMNQERLNEFRRYRIELGLADKIDTLIEVLILHKKIVPITKEEFDELKEKGEFVIEHVYEES